MTGVRNTQNVSDEVKKKLGFNVVANISFFWGVPYPLPNWYWKLSALKKTLWMVYCRFGDFMTFLLFLSNVVELFLAYGDIRSFVTCTGTVTYIICFRIKMHIYQKRSKNLENVIDSLHKITESLHNNPVKNTEFFEIYQEFFKHAVFFGKGKIGATAGGVFTLAIYEMIHGSLQDSNEKRNLPMFGWYPYNPYDLTNFEISCLFQLVSYLSFLLKDVTVDLLFLTILVVVNTQLIYLRILLERIIRSHEKSDGLVMAPEKKKLLIWWINHHQMILRTIEDFKVITNPYLFYKYISVGIILFFGGVLVTSNTEYDLVQQMIVLAINSSNLLQLYIFSIMGDEITENVRKCFKDMSLRLIEHGLHIDIFNSSKNVKMMYLYIATKCSRPILIHFGQINPLCVSSFAQIVKVTFSYFITIVQIRDKALQIDNEGIGLLNSTAV